MDIDPASPSSMPFHLRIQMMLGGANVDVNITSDSPIDGPSFFNVLVVGGNTLSRIVSSTVASGAAAENSTFAAPDRHLVPSTPLAEVHDHHPSSSPMPSSLSLGSLTDSPMKHFTSVQSDFERFESRDSLAGVENQAPADLGSDATSASDLSDLLSRDADESEAAKSHAAIREQEVIHTKELEEARARVHEWATRLAEGKTREKELKAREKKLGAKLAASEALELELKAQLVAQAALQLDDAQAVAKLKNLNEKSKKLDPLGSVPKPFLPLISILRDLAKSSPGPVTHAALAVRLRKVSPDCIAAAGVAKTKAYMNRAANLGLVKTWKTGTKKWAMLSPKYL